jgi:hypothetical protein
VPDRCGLFLDARLSARHRGSGGWSALTRSHAARRVAHAHWDGTDVSPRRRREPAWPRLGRDARTPAFFLAGQDLCLVLAGIRGDRMVGHDHALDSGCHRPHRREPVRAGVPRGPGDCRNPRAASAARRGLPQRLQGSYRRRGGTGRRWGSRASRPA